MSLRTRILAGTLVSAAVAVGFAAPSFAASSSSTVSGSVWKDSNRNQAIDAGEAGVSGMYVYLESSTGSVLSAATTDAAGAFAFTGVSDGTYRVEIGGSSWSSWRADWVPTTTGTSLYPRVTVTVAGGAVRTDFGLRQIVRSTTDGSPITAVTGPSGLRVESYDDVVPASTLYDDLAGAGFLGDEASHTVVQFDLAASSATATGADRDATGRYSNYSALSAVTYLSWVDSADRTLFHEYGHAWSLYYAYIVQQDPSLSGYLQARGLSGDSRVGSSYTWNPQEMIAEDYRQLFGSATAAAAPQVNTAIPPAASVPGLRDYLANTFRTGAAPAAPVNLRATADATGVTLSWDPATSGGAPSSYRVFRDGTAIGTSTTTSFTDSGAVGGASYSYAVSALNAAGESALSAPVSVTVAPAPQVTDVAMNPAPVKSSGTASYRLSSTATVTARIETTSGTTVRTLQTGVTQAAGLSSVSWGRTNDAGRRVSSGTYVLRVIASTSAGTTTGTTTFKVS